MLSSAPPHVGANALAKTRSVSSLYPAVPAQPTDEEASVSEPTYTEIGATESGELPPGYRHARLTTDLGRGVDVMAHATNALMTFQMHRRAGLRPAATAPRAAVGVDLICRPGAGPLAVRVPCRIVWAADDPRHTGFGCGTLAGHPVRGEEAFVLNHDTDDVVRFHVRSFSAPASPLARAAGPVMHVMQDATYRWYLATMRRLVR